MELQRILRLARSGSPERAWARLIESGLGASEDPRALTLKARLVKDRAKRAGPGEAGPLFAEAAALYERAAREGAASYPLINAATLWLLAGRRRQAEALAERVLQLLEVDPDEAETPYWLGATRAEALLVLGKSRDARVALEDAVARAPRAWEDRAATVGQFTLLCEYLAIDARWLDAVRPPRSLQYAGILSTPHHDPDLEHRIADWLRSENVGFGYGALAAGADIWIAEALLEVGAELNVVLPCPKDVFRERSVAAVGAAWLPRFDRLIERAASVEELDAGRDPSPAAVDLTNAVTLGLAIHNARVLESEALQLHVAGEDDSRGRALGGPVRGASFQCTRQHPAPEAPDPDATRAAAFWLGMGSIDLGAPRSFAHPSEAWAAAKDEGDRSAAAAFDYRVVGPAGGDEDAVARLRAIGEVAEPGQALATREFAFALLAELPDVRVETIGDIRSASGFAPVFALI